MGDLIFPGICLHGVKRHIVLPELCRTAISEIRMKLFSVIKDFDIFKKILLGLFTGLIDFVMHAFYFKRVEKTFDSCIMVTVLFSTHTTRYVPASQYLLKL